jgi:hypothetical protein
MRYLTHYTEYPIYEAAEGGYYYSGNEIAESEKMSKRAAKKSLKKIYEESVQTDNDPKYPWVISQDGNKVWRGSKYIGEGESYVIEKRQGSQTKGYVPYC